MARVMGTGRSSFVRWMGSSIYSRNLSSSEDDEGRYIDCASHV